MKKILISLLLFLQPVSALYSQDQNSFPGNFINDLIYENNPARWVQPQEIERSIRLGITYDSVKYKFLISYDIDPAVKQNIIMKRIPYEAKVEKPEAEYTHLTFSVSSIKYDKHFYFKDTLLISPPNFFSRNWQNTESKYFIFVVSDSHLFNNFCADNFDRFIDSVSINLGLTKEDMQNLERQKIYYYLCRDEKEIELLTGYKSRGNYILAYDYIITTYNAHYHEIIHLLVNYRLKKLPLYTHSFFQEGIAAGLGGRGGYEPGIMLNLGKFLEQSEFLSYKKLLNSKEYKTIDPSMAYPLSGLYNLFLLNHLGTDNYLKLYRKYSGTSNEVNDFVINIPELPAEGEWENFIDTLLTVSVFPGGNTSTMKLVHQAGNNKIYDTDSAWVFELEDYLLISSSNPISNYTSKKFSEEFPGKIYNGEKYLLKAGKAEVSVYNLYTNNLIASYASGFSADMKPVPSENGLFVFSVPKSMFEEKLEECLISK